MVVSTAVEGRTAYPDYLDPVEGLSRDDLNRLQEAGVMAMCHRAYRRAPLIRQVWQDAGLVPSDVRSMADFVAKAPFITKDSMREFRDRHNDPAGGMGHFGPGEILSIGTTSGTTGDPTPIPSGSRASTEDTFTRDLWHHGLRPGDYHTALAFTFRGGFRRRMVQELNIAEIIVSMAPGEIPFLCEASKRFRPTTMASVSNPLLLALEQYFERTGEDPVEVFKSYKAAIFGGEPLSVRLGALAKSWGLDLYENTGVGDVSSAAECKARAGMHAYEDVTYLECIDPDGADPVPDGGLGELVVTSLSENYLPIVRYRTGDLVSMDRSQCACGRNHVRFKVLGRTSDQIIVEGRTILPRELMMLIEQHSETRAGLFQIIRTAREMDALKLRVGYDAGRLSDGQDRLGQRLRDDLTAAIGVRVEIELVLDQELLKLGPPHKIPRVTKA
ncbi:MAG: hypothetical protein ABW039_12090 [Sphingobium sp.]